MSRLIDADFVIESLNLMVAQVDIRLDGNVGNYTKVHNDLLIKAQIEEIIRGISELPTVNQWISVSERLPEETIKVLVRADDMYYNMNNDTGILIGWRNGNKWSTLTTKGWESIRCPIAWMPLPEPYEKRE